MGVWLKILRGDVLQDDHFLMTIWEISGLDTPDPGINNLCCSFSSSPRSAVFTVSFAFLTIILLASGSSICIYPETSQEWISQSMHYPFLPSPKCFPRKLADYQHQPFIQKGSFTNSEPLLSVIVHKEHYLCHFVRNSMN